MIMTRNGGFWPTYTGLALGTALVAYLIYLGQVVEPARMAAEDAAYLDCREAGRAIDVCEIAAYGRRISDTN